MKGRRRLDFSDAQARLHKVFYIHCPGYPRENWLRREIIKFGGKVESFLSKDVHVLITNQPSGSSHSNPTLTALSPLSCTTSSSRMWIDSPLSAENPAAAVITRGKALAMQAAKTQCNGSMDVVENSKRLGVRVWPLESAVRALRKAKREENRRSITSPPPSNIPMHCTKTLKPPFLKVEDSTNRFKPIFSEFDYWPVMDYLDKIKLDPGFEHGKLITPYPLLLDHSDPHSPFKPRIQPLLTLHRLNRQDLRQPLTPPDPPALPVPGEPREKSSSVDLGRQKVRKEKRAKPLALRPEQKGILKKQVPDRRGYCEACLSRYTSVKEHRRSRSHQEFIANSNNFIRLDAVISEFASLEQIVGNFSSAISVFSDSISDSTEEVTSPFPHSNTPFLSPTYQSPYTPSKVWDSARCTPLTCISFRPDATLLSYTSHYENKPTTPNLTDRDTQSTPRLVQPVFTTLSPTPLAPPEEVKRSYTIPIDTPSHGAKPEITLFIPSSSPEPSAMEWCESISQICPRSVTVGEGKIAPHKDTTFSHLVNETIAETSKDTAPPVQTQTPIKRTQDSVKWLEDAKTPPLPKNMDPRLFKFINYPYRQSKVDAFKKLSKLL